MRWGRITLDGPKVGDKREILSFLVIPKCINSEWRWLEWARWDEIYREGVDLSPGVTGHYGSMSTCVFWAPVRWKSTWT